MRQQRSVRHTACGVPASTGVGGELTLLAACSSGTDDGMDDMDHGSEHGHTSEAGDAHAGYAADGGRAPEGIVEATDPTCPVGTEVVLLAEHMSGMKGATATIDSSTQETVCMVDVDADGMEMTNHKWVVESEMQPAG